MRDLYCDCPYYITGVAIVVFGRNKNVSYLNNDLITMTILHNRHYSWVFYLNKLTIYNLSPT